MHYHSDIRNSGCRCFHFRPHFEAENSHCARGNLVLANERESTSVRRSPIPNLNSTPSNGVAHDGKVVATYLAGIAFGHVHLWLCRRMARSEASSSASIQPRRRSVDGSRLHVDQFASADRARSSRPAWQTARDVGKLCRSHPRPWTKS
ncbi:MAG: hypothetical protein JWP89_5250 [Schlesneria sp.]|nr:hypothetical protein [Schlesneria sp.]